MMRRKILLPPVALVLLALSAGSVLAAVNWKSGPTATFPDAYTFNIVGEASGLGNRPAIAHVTVHGTVTYTCQNKGGNQSPGQNPVDATTTFDQNLGNSDHNGRGILDVTATVTASATISGKVAGCPNGNWTGVDPQPFPVPITSVDVTITQGNTTLYSATFTP